LAASSPNICDFFITLEQDSLTVPWHKLASDPGEGFWLNPSFAKSRFFIPKCAKECELADKAGTHLAIASIVQTATSSDYWKKWVWGNPYVCVIYLKGRVPFVGYINPKTGKPAGANIDCSILHWSPENKNLELSERLLIWDWRKVESQPVKLWT